MSGKGVTDTGLWLLQPFGNAGAPGDAWILAAAAFPTGTLPLDPDRIPGLKVFVAWLTLFPECPREGNRLLDHPVLGTNYLATVRSLCVVQDAERIAQAKTPGEFLRLLREAEDKAMEASGSVS